MDTAHLPNWYFLTLYWVLLASTAFLFVQSVRYWWRQRSAGRLAIAMQFLGASLFVAYRVQLRYIMDRGWLSPNSILFAVVLTFWAGAVVWMLWEIRRGSIMRRQDDTAEVIVV